MALEKMKINFKDKQTEEVLSKSCGAVFPTEEFEFDRFATHLELNDIEDKVFELCRLFGEELEVDVSKLNGTVEEKKRIADDFDSLFNNTGIGVIASFKVMRDTLMDFDFENGVAELLADKAALDFLISAFSGKEDLIMIKRTYSQKEPFEPAYLKMKEIAKELKTVLEKRWHIKFIFGDDTNLFK